MTRRSVTSNVRRFLSSQRGTCARGALVYVLCALLAFSPISIAQDLRLQPSGSTTPAESQPTPAPEADGPPLPPQRNAEPEVAPPADRVTKPAADAGKGAAATPKKPVDLNEALERRGDLNLHEVQLNQALFMISEQWGINVVAGDVKGSVNGVFRQAPLREILDSILLSNGYNYRPVGESLVISSVDQLGQINPFFQSATIPVRTADIDEIVQGARLLTTPKGQVQPIKSAHSIVVLDFPDRVQMIRDFVKAIDGASQSGTLGGGAQYGQPLQVGYFRTQYIPAKTAEDALQAVLSKEGRAVALEKEDRVIVTDYAENLAMVQKVIERIDRPRPQVMVTALIYDISLEDIEKLGINWQHTLKSSALTAAGKPQQAFGVDSVTAVPFDAGKAGSTLSLISLNKNLDITAIIQALQEANDARLLADPHAAVLENEEAVFQSVSEIPYQQLTQTSQGGNIGTTAFKEAGITLRVRPKIAADGTIRMEVAPEFSRLTGFTPGDNQPIIDRRTASTTICVANGQTVVIGGLRQRSDVGDFTGVPYLKDMRVVGKLFRARETNVRESELVVFISPQIISCAEPLNHREQMIVDTVGCRLNQIPEGEGCPQCMPMVGPVRLPPSPCDANGPPAQDSQTAPTPAEQLPTGMEPLPGEEIPPPQDGVQLKSTSPPTAKIAQPIPVAITPPPQVRRLPVPEQIQTVSATSTASGLFAPPPQELSIKTDEEPAVKVGGWIQGGARVGTQPTINRTR